MMAGISTKLAFVGLLVSVVVTIIWTCFTTTLDHLADKRIPSESGNSVSLRNAFLNGPQPEGGDGKWITDISFDEMGEFGGQAWAGTEAVPSEPSMAWVLGKVKFESHQEKAELINAMTQFLVHESFLKGGMSFGKQLSNGNLASLVFLREEDPSIQETFVSNLALTAGEVLLHLKLLVAGKYPSIMFKFDKYHNKIRQQILELGDEAGPTLKKFHKAHGPSGKHWYIVLVATDPNLRGQGHASQVMRRVAELADLAQMDCYLEATSQKLVKFYQKFDFKVVAEGQPSYSINRDPFTLSFMIRKYHAIKQS